MQSLDQFLATIRPPMTPVLIVRRSALEANIAAMQAACDAAGVRLRAHGKMHKTSQLGRAQIQAGAVGLCCQTIGEAEAYAAAGIADLLVTSPMPPWGWPRLAAIARDARVAAVVDSAAQIDLARLAASAAGVTLGIVIDVDPGMHRTGAAPQDVVALARHVTGATSLRYDGIQAYSGQLQHVSDRTARTEANASATAMVKALVAELVAAVLAPPVVTGGGTGTYALDLAAGVYTELQCGSYALMDVEYTDCGAPVDDWPFAPALFVAASVVSARHPTHVACDAGLKAVAVDGPAARVVSPMGCSWRAMGDEHGAIIGSDLPGEGALVFLQPGHCDPTINLYDALFVVDEDGALERWPIDARRVTA
jgi:D-serine deaminase-like pyridoxal phosphate-dependent protein